jgi:hypothetical protein
MVTDDAEQPTRHRRNDRRLNELKPRSEKQKATTRFRLFPTMETVLRSNAGSMTITTEDVM